METAGTQFESTALAAIPLWNWCRQVLRLSTVGTSIFWPTPAERQRHGSSTTLRYPGVAVFTTTARRSEEHTSELQSLMRISYAVFCLKKKKKKSNSTHEHTKQQRYN